MSFSQGFSFHEHLLPVWDSNIKHNGFLPLSSPAPLCGSFHSQTLFSVLRLKFPSGCRCRACELAVSITMSLARRFSRRERSHVRDRASHNVLLVYFFGGFFRHLSILEGSLPGAPCCYTEIKKSFYSSVSHGWLAWRKKKNQKIIREAKKCQASFCLFG